MSWPKKPPAWSAGKSHEYLRPYWDGHMFIAVYLHACGYSYAHIGRVIGYDGGRVKQLVQKAERIVKYHPRYRSDEIITCAESNL